jgi:adenylate cyclase
MHLGEEERALVVSRMRVVAFQLAVPLVLLFSVVDWFYAPDRVREFFFVRLLIVPVGLLAYCLYRLRSVRERHFLIPPYLLVVFLGAYNAYLTSRTGYEFSSYYAGLNLVAIGAMFFLPVPPRQLWVVFGLTYLPYGIVLALSPSRLAPSYFIPHLAFILSTVFIGFLAHRLNRQLRRSEILARTRLREEIRSKDKIIEQKTREGIYLERLASQFSPQVISAIKQGEISVTDRLRREVTCIFVDIVNSTDRSRKIDQVDYVSMVSEFFSEVIEVFLKHNVTIGTYLGDGLLAFTNAPQSREDHARVAVEACLDVLKRHRQKRKYYAETWRSRFNIRIGVNTGFAHLGFFPNERNGAYTAVGGTVNLAARLCALAAPNSLCITKYQLKRIGLSLPDSYVELHSASTRIKGYEKEKFELYSVLPASAPAADGSRCPVCSAELRETRDFGAIILMKCTRCAYLDPVTKD